MNMLIVPGGWYCESQPNGAYAVVVRGSHIDTHLGRVELCPGGDLLQLRLAADGIRFAGTGHNDGIAWEWTGSEWVNHGPTFGNSACIYDASDMLNVVSRNVEPTWAQGWAFVDDHGQLVPGWVAYNPKDSLSAWTKHGDIAIGQGHDGGGVITAHGEHEIAKGEATWVRFNQSGDRIALAWIQQDHNEARLLWLTVAELLALPPIADSNQPPVVTKPPVVPQPTPEPKPMAVPNQLSTVQRIRAKYPTPLGARHPAFLIEVAQATGAKLLRKDNGTHVTLPNGVNVSQDILGFRDGAECYDVLGDAEGAATPGWGEKGAIAGEWIDVSGLVTNNPTVPPQVPPSQSVNCDKFTVRIAELERQLAEANATIELLHTVPQHAGYDDMMAMVAAADAVYEGAQRQRNKAPMFPSLTAHLVWRLMFEGFTKEALIEDARERGAFL